MKVIGITGGIASGKSTVTNYLKKLGYTVLDSDTIAHDIIKQPLIVQKIQDRFGDGVIVEGQVNRSLLGKLIFSNEQAKLDLNAIVHPEVIREIQTSIDHFTGDLLFVDVPLLYEAKMDSMMDAVMVVYVEFETQIQRLIQRDHIAQDYAIKKIQSQMALSEKAKKADFVVDNNQSITQTYLQIEEILRRIQNEI